MEPTQNISASNPYPADSLDYNNVAEHASQGYFRSFWSSYKGHVRGMLAGTAIGIVLGGAIGLGVAAATGVGVAVAVPAIAGIGGYLCAQAYGDSGAAAASRAEGLAERHARILDPTFKGTELTALNDKLMADGRGHNFQYPQNRDKDRYFNWKSGSVGAMAGAAVGALLSTTGTLAKMSLFAGAPGAATVAGAALAFGALGLTFGIDRSVLKGIFNQVDANSRGKAGLGQKGPDLGKAQYTSMESDASLANHRLNRQESIAILEEEYHNKIFAGSVKGMFRGFAGGTVAGAVIGAAIGLAAFAAVATFPAAAAALSIAPSMAGIVSSFAGAGALYGMKTFADAGREAGAESTARAIDNEFERNQELRERGITPPPPKPQEKIFVNVKAAALMGTIGAAVAAVAPALFTVPAIAAAGMTIPAQAAAAVVGGLVGSLYGLGSDSLKQISKATDWVYKKSFVAETKTPSTPYVVAEGVEQAPAPAIPVRSATPAITAADLAAMDKRMNNRPQKSFEQTLLTQQQPQTATQTL